MNGCPSSCPGVVHGDEVGVVEPSDVTGLVLEAACEALVLAEAVEEHLDRDLATEGPVVGGEDLRHPAAAEHAAELVASGEDATFTHRGSVGRGDVP
jgi:hypothetical protein